MILIVVQVAVPRAPAAISSSRHYSCFAQQAACQCNYEPSGAQPALELLDFGNGRGEVPARNPNSTVTGTSLPPGHRANELR